MLRPLEQQFFTEGLSYSKYQGSACLVASIVSDSMRSTDCSPPAPLSMGFSRQEYWSGFSCSLPGDLPNPGIKPTFVKSLALAGRFFTTTVTWEALCQGKAINFCQPALKAPVPNQVKQRCLKEHSSLLKLGRKVSKKLGIVPNSIQSLLPSSFFCANFFSSFLVTTKQNLTISFISKTQLLHVASPKDAPIHYRIWGPGGETHRQ